MDARTLAIIDEQGPREAARLAWLAFRDERRPIDRRHARPRESRRQPKLERKDKVNL